jgi:predicted ArsR family transcriptional regulator
MVPDLANRLASVSVLSDPVRRELYLHVAAQDGPVGRAAAAAAVGVPRTVAAFHLDRLVEAGLLDVAFGRTTERRGPGSGRPAKLYRRSEREHRLSLPPRAYELAARLMAEAVDRAGADGALYEVAEREGRRTGAALAGDPADDALALVAAALARCGYEPRRAGEGLRLRTCPFHELSQSAQRPLVCGMSLAWLAGVVGGLEADGLEARMDPRPGECCVLISKSKTD